MSSEFVHSSTTGPLQLTGVCAAAQRAKKDRCDVEVVFRIAEGPKVHTRSLVVSGVEGTSERLVRGEMTLEEGSILRESDMNTTRANLLRIGVFERVAVHPNEEQQEAAAKDVLVEVRERKAQSIEVGVGVSSEEGGRVFANYTHGNLFGTALRFQANGKVNYNPFVFLYPAGWQDSITNFYNQFTPLQHIQGFAAIGFAYPQFFGLPRGLGAGLDLSYNHQYSPAYAQNTFTAVLNQNYRGFRPTLFDRPRPITFLLKETIEHSVLKCNEALAETIDPMTGKPPVILGLCSKDAVGGVGGQPGAVTYGIAGPNVRIDLTDDPLNPHAGVLLEGGAEFGKGLEVSTPDFVRLEAKGSVFLPLPFRTGFATSLSLRRIIRASTPLCNSMTPQGLVTAPCELPINKHYFAGGGSTIRGYPEQALFPVDSPPPPVSAENPIVISNGGLILFVLKNEFRFPIAGALGGALFYDIGDLYNTWANIDLNPANMRQGAGVGIRFETPVGPLSLDFAVPLTTPKDQFGNPFPGEKCSFLPLNACPSFSVRSF
jgi:outer membrane protein assembly factor BamA